MLVKLGKVYMISVSQMDTMMEDNEAEIEALEKEKEALQKSIGKLVSDFNSQRDVLLASQEHLEWARTANQEFNEKIVELEREIIALQKAAFTPLPIEAPTKNKGGRPKKAQVQ